MLYDLLDVLLKWKRNGYTFPNLLEIVLNQNSEILKRKPLYILSPYPQSFSPERKLFYLRERSVEYGSYSSVLSKSSWSTASSRHLSWYKSWCKSPSTHSRHSTEFGSRYLKLFSRLWTVFFFYHITFYMVSIIAPLNDSRIILSMIYDITIEKFVRTMFF